MTHTPRCGVCGDPRVRVNAPQGEKLCIRCFAWFGVICNEERFAQWLDEIEGKVTRG